jgi:hypothetical protein
MIFMVFIMMVILVITMKPIVVMKRIGPFQRWGKFGGDGLRWLLRLANGGPTAFVPTSIG